MNENIEIVDIALHYVGNRSSEEGVVVAEHSLKVSEEIVPFLKYFFLSPFKMEALCNFYHESELRKNEMYTLTQNIFEDHELFMQSSSEIAKYLYERSNHPKIKGGNFFVVLFKNVEVDHQLVEAIGLFKIENTENFIRINRDGINASVVSENGVSINKLEKGCLVLNIEKEKGYVVAAIDRTSRGAAAKYWIDDFLHIVPRDDGFNQTKKAVEVCKSYICSLATHVEKSQRALMLNRVAKMLKDGTFDIGTMTEVVFGDADLSTEFKEYRRHYDGGEDMVEDHFSTEPAALKRLSFGNLTNIRLDNNFGISIRGGENLLEKGFDPEKGMKYYKLYYREEK